MESNPRGGRRTLLGNIADVPMAEKSDEMHMINARSAHKLRGANIQRLRPPCWLSRGIALAL